MAIAYINNAIGTIGLEAQSNSVVWNSVKNGDGSCRMSVNDSRLFI